MRDAIRLTKKRCLPLNWYQACLLSLKPIRKQGKKSVKCSKLLNEECNLRSENYTGLQLRNSEQNCFHDHFLNQTLWCDPHWNRLSETIPMSGNIIGFGWEIRKLAFWKLSILDLICCPDYRCLLLMILSTCAEYEFNMWRASHINSMSLKLDAEMRSFWEFQLNTNVGFWKFQLNTIVASFSAILTWRSVKSVHLRYRRLPVQSKPGQTKNL